MPEKAEETLKNDLLPSSHKAMLKKIQQLFGKMHFNKTAGNYIDAASIELHLLEEMQVGVYLIDYVTGQYLYVNNQMSKLTGIPRDEVQNGGFDILERIIHPVDYLPVLEIIKKTGEQIQRLNGEELKSVNFKLFYRIRHANGSYVNVMQLNKLIMPIPGEHPIDMGMIVTLPDVKSSKVSGHLKSNEREWFFPSGKTSGRIENLSRRELEVLTLVAAGNTSKTIAEKLNLSTQTIKIHRKNILKKLEVKTSLLAIRIFDEEFKMPA